MSVFRTGGLPIITIADGIVRHTGAGIPADRVIDCSGLFVLPAATDMHVHMRGGPQSAKEDWETGTRSALAGGVTVVVDQPNTVPPVTHRKRSVRGSLKPKENSFCHFAINSGVTHDTPLPAMWSAGAMAFGEIFFAPSSYGEAVSPQELSVALDQIHSFGGLATIHAEEIIAGPDTSLESHAQVRSPEGECGRSGRSCRPILRSAGSISVI